ncbi:hypothetical protein [Synechococcus sp. EJ6-Ellesmere]|uniref:hypothetical protein n=1 Tax=Synechococcus sp. EJ6-Ellesmere TaxID=2823734 RepID=UPI0020CFCD56|nr:hypothetical protein [Synechococcus sp. EJ6-Ellesmere]MCP9826401.1 hypothetical protein [Synechococcus sp. EJ6-Ellesmere]
MRFTVPLALATATAFSVSALPVRAFPGASVNLVRVNGDGVTALPGLQPPAVQVPPSAPGTAELISQASGESQTEPAGSPFPLWIIPVVLGLGVGICAIAGCFDSGGGGGGGGGDNPVSR